MNTDLNLTNTTVEPGVLLSTPTEEKRLALKLFGPPQIHHGGEPLDLTRRQTRALLYRLGARFEPVSREELVGLFWPECDDNTARRNLVRLVHLVKESLPNPSMLTVTTAAVSIDPEQVWSDADMLAGLVRRDTVTAWKQVVELYRGPFLAGFFLPQNAEYDYWQAKTAAHLHHCCLEALAKLIDYYTACGEHRMAVHYAQRYLEIENTAETVHCQLMQLYARLGERELVQRQFEQCVLMLERELGVEPLSETRAAYALALHHTCPPYHVRPAAPWPHPASDLYLPFTGRTQTLLQLERAYQRLKHGGVILLCGEAGIGKTRLMHEFAGDQNALVLSGRCYSGLDLFAYHPLVEALRPALFNLTFAERAIDPVWLAEAERILPELRSIFPDLPAAPAHNAEKVQLRLFEALVQLLTGLAKPINVLLCLDDLQWADKATLLWLQYLSTRLSGSGVCICATYHVEEGAAVAGLKRSLKRSGVTTEIELEPLDVSAVFGLVRTMQKRCAGGADVAAAATATIVERIYTATGGNTFFVLELIRELTISGGLVQPPAQLPVPGAIQETIARRLEQVSAIARQVLEAASVLDAPLDFALLQMTSGRNEAEVGDGLRELTRFQLLCDSAGILQFQNAIVQQVIRASLPVWRRQLLQQRAAEARQHWTPAAPAVG